MAGTNRTLFTNEVLKKKATVFKDIVACIEDLSEQPEKGGKSATRICADHDIDYISLRRIMNIKELDKIYLDRELEHDVIVIETNPYEKLCLAIFGLKEGDIKEFPLELEESIDYAMDKYLNERERTVLTMRFGLTECTHILEEVGREFKVTRDRIAQIEKKALRKLRHPTPAKIIKNGLTQYNLECKRVEVEKEAKQEKFNEEMKRLDNELERKKKENEENKKKQEKLCDIISNKYKDLTEEEMKKIYIMVERYASNIPMKEVIDRCDNTMLKCSLGRNFLDDTLFTLLTIEDSFLLKYVNNIGKKSLETLNKLCNTLLTDGGIAVTRDQFQFIYKTLLPNEDTLIYDTIDLEIEELKNQGKSIVDIIDEIASKVRIDNYDPQHKYELYKIPSNNRPVYIGDIIHKSLAYYGCTDVTSRYDRFECTDERIVNSIISICNKFLTRHFNMKHNEYLAKINVIKTDENKDEYNKIYEDIRKMATHAVYNLVEDQSELCLYIESKNMSELRSIVGAITIKIYCWASNDYYYNLNSVERSVLGEPIKYFTKEEIDPMIVITFVSEACYALYHSIKG